jgi:hypothetical protein
MQECYRMFLIFNFNPKVVLFRIFCILYFAQNFQFFTLKIMPFGFLCVNLTHTISDLQFQSKNRTAQIYCTPFFCFKMPIKKSCWPNLLYPRMSHTFSVIKSCCSNFQATVDSLNSGIEGTGKIFHHFESKNGAFVIAAVKNWVHYIESSNISRVDCI